ncbi:MAG: UDP-N-acetylmuramoyl-L-alanyl-D-glutamate--2,6-diaminopimelate ligase [Gemmatimonadetes bacterium]|nr:UDP-N-acetylmuramoyl-L-alanyl-D-glutamate--2,6-diaminopimelate ligase [Gemmatimonadota bacterium]
MSAAGAEPSAGGVRLKRVVARLDAEGLLVSAPPGDAVLSGISDDSRQVESGHLFCAWAGTAMDSHRFVPAAASAGAAAALVERRVDESPLPQVIVRDGRRAAAVAAALVFGEPARRLTLVGVTGTNGKTTTAWLLRHLLAASAPAAFIGTLGMIVEGRTPLPGTEALTTPGPVDLARRFRELVDRGVRAAALEVSSHALEQGRVDALRFHAAVFTNLTRDHLDYHGTEAAYLAAKRKLVGLLREDGVAVLNADDPAWAGLERAAPRAVRFGTESPDADVRATDVRTDAAGARFRLTTPAGSAAVVLPLLGAFNVQNALGAAAACHALGMAPATVAARLASAPQVPGRLERIAGHPCPVLTDYAHTPDALGRALAALRPLASGRLIVVFGAGGDRDRGKRPLMGAVVLRGADLAIVTSDNPRTEDPERIIDEIVAGMAGRAYVRERDRRQAIALALAEAKPGDLVLLAGKGHETYQVVGTEKIPFDERAIVQAWLDEHGAEVET